MESAISPAYEEGMEEQNTVPVLIVVKDGLLSSSKDIHWGGGGLWPTASSVISLPSSSTTKEYQVSSDREYNLHSESPTSTRPRPTNYSEPSLHTHRRAASQGEAERNARAPAITTYSMEKLELSIPHTYSKSSAVQSMKIKDYFNYEEEVEDDVEDLRKGSTDSKYCFFDQSFKALCEEHLQMEMGNRGSIFLESLEVDYPLDFDDDDDSDFEFEIDDDSSDDEEILTPLTPRPNPSKRCSDPHVQVLPACSEEGEIENQTTEETVYLADDAHSIRECQQRPALGDKNPSDFLAPQTDLCEKNQQVVITPSSPRASSMSSFVPASSTQGAAIPTPERSQSESAAGKFVVGEIEEESRIVLHLCPEHNVLSGSHRPCLCPSTLEMYDLGKLEDTKYDVSSTHRITRVFSSLRHKKDSLSVDKTQLLRKASRLRKLSRKPSQSPFADLSEIVRPFSPPVGESEDIPTTYTPDVDASLDAFAEWLSNPHPFEGNPLRGGASRPSEHDITTSSPKVNHELESGKSYFREDVNSSLLNLKRLSTRSLLPEFIPDEATNHLRDWDLFLHIHKTVTIKDKKIHNLVGDGPKGFADVPLEYIDHKGLPAIMASKAPMAYFLTHLLQSQHHQWLMFLWEFVTLEEGVGTTRLKQMAKMYELYLNPEGYLFLGWDVLASEENFTSVNPSQLLPQLKDRAWRILAREFDVWWGQEHPLMRRMFKTIGLNTTRVDILKLREAFSYPLQSITASFNDLLSKHQGALGPDIVFEDSPRGKIVRHHSAIRTLQRKFCETVMGVDNQFFNIKIGDFKELGVRHPDQSPNSSCSEIVA